MFDADVMVVGGGPAGLASAIAARRRGFRVILADARQPPVDKTCGEGLLPDALAAAAKLGIEIPVGAGIPFAGIRFVGPSQSVAAQFPAGPGRGIRRTTLHSLLAAAAESAGVELLWGVPVTGLDRHGVHIQNRSLRARWIVGADGAQSAVRRWTGISEAKQETGRFGFRAHYPVAPWSEYVEIHWGDGCQFYVTPVAANEICVALISRDPHLRIAQALPRFPALESRLAGVSPCTVERGSATTTRRFPNVAAGNIALVGDASATVDAITGEGLCLALKQALALARALEASDLSLYRRQHGSVVRRAQFSAGFLLSLDRSPKLRHRALNALSRRPELFARLLSVHVGHSGALQFAATAASLGWTIATA